MAVVDNQNYPESKLAKQIEKQVKSKAEEKAKEVGKKAGKKAGKVAMALIAKIAGIIMGFIFAIFTPLICIILIAAIALNYFFSYFSVEQYAQENPELVRIFLDNNYAEFEAQVNKYTHSPEFISFVCESEFDNGYTKLVYGGTKAYTQEELKGNFVGVQGQYANWVTAKDSNGNVVKRENYDKNQKYTYEATSVLEKIQYYIDKGVDPKKIKINDQYLKGYQEASGYYKESKEDESGSGESSENDETEDMEETYSMDFETWINNSYFVIPYYFHWNMALNSEYVEPTAGILGAMFEDPPVGLPNWRTGMTNESCMVNADYTDKNNEYHKVFNADEKPSLTYKQYLKTNWGKKYAKDHGWDAYGDPYNTVYADDIDNNGKAYYAQGVMLGYKMERIEDWFTAFWNSKIANKDKDYEYIPFVKYPDLNYQANRISDLYIHSWFNQKNGDTTNYEKYLMTPKNIDTISKREKSNKQSIENTNIEEWLDKFAEYFAKEIYYIYPNRDYIVDFFLNDDESEEMRQKRITFLQRSFYAMATGSSLDYELEEKYTIMNGALTSTANENVVGYLDVSKVEFTKITPVCITDTESLDPTYVKNQKELNKAIKELKKDKKEYYDSYVEQFPHATDEEKKDNQTIYATLEWQAELKLTYNDNSSKKILIPIDTYLILNALSDDFIMEEFTFNSESYSGNDELDGSYFRDLIKIKWDQNYYDAQTVYESDNDTPIENPLDNFDLNDFKLNDYTTVEWDIDLKKISVKSMKKAINNYIKSQDTNPLFNLFSGELKGKRNIELSYSDHSILTYGITEICGAGGKVEGINVEIYTYYPDVSQYTEGNYRVAYGFENDGRALQEALHLMQYVQENKDNTGILPSMEGKVDISQLLVWEDDGSYIEAGNFFSDSDLVEFIKETITAHESKSLANPYTAINPTSFAIGRYQYNNSLAQKCLRQTCIKLGKENSVKLLGESYYAAIMDENSNWEYSAQKYRPNATEVEGLRKFLETKQCAGIQEQMMTEIAETRINEAKGYGISSPGAIVYFVNLKHHLPAGANDTVQAILHDGLPLSLDNLHQYAKRCSTFLNSYQQIYVPLYEKCKTIKVFDSSNGYKGKVADVLKYALSSHVQGKPYGRGDDWRLDGPVYKSMYDCSLLVLCAYYYGADFDFGGNYNAASQETYLRNNNYQLVCGAENGDTGYSVINCDLLKPGDVVFFNDGDSANYKRAHNIGHVALYIGDGKVAEAGGDKSPAGIYNLVGRNYYRVYRIIKESGSSTSTTTDKNKKTDSDTNKNK